MAVLKRQEQGLDSVRFKSWVVWEVDRELKQSVLYARRCRTRATSADGRPVLRTPVVVGIPSLVVAASLRTRMRRASRAPTGT